MIWCLGLYASGSTWLYNVTRDVAAAVRPGEDIRACYAEGMKMLEPIIPGNGIKIVKSHYLDARATAHMTENAATILLTIRDPRDAVVSLMQHMRHNFVQALARVENATEYCGRFGNDKRVILLRYESGFIDDPATLRTLAEIFGRRLAPGDQARLFAASRRAAIEAKIARLEDLPTTVTDKRSGDVVDLDSQWHRHHANRKGEIGKWPHFLAQEAVNIIETRLGGWMEANGYVAAGNRMTPGRKGNQL